MVIAGVSRRTMYNWMASNRVVYVRTAGGRVRIDRTTLKIPPAIRVLIRSCFNDWATNRAPCSSAEPLPAHCDQ